MNDMIIEELELADRVYTSKVLNMLATRDIQIIRAEDYQYQCFIDKNCYFSAFTPYGALVLGIHVYLEELEKEK